jgi:hypothetical protein
LRAGIYQKAKGKKSPDQNAVDSHFQDF